MSNRKPRSGRATAVEVLNRVDIRQEFVADKMGTSLSRSSEPGRAKDIVMAVVRNQPLIDSVLEEVSKNRVERVSKKLINILRVGCCELIYNPKTPVYSIVDEAVNIADMVGGKKQKGFVNAVLRNIDRAITDRDIQFDFSLAKRMVPTNAGRGCLFSRDILPLPQEDHSWYLSKAFSLPDWLMQRWIDKHEFERAFQIAEGSNRNPSVYLRVNRLKITPAELNRRFEEAEIEAEPVREHFLRLIKAGSVSKLPGFDEGLFVVQDLTASEPVEALQLSADEKILDLCAAPGTKTTQIAEETGDLAKIVATDSDAIRLKKVTENIERLRLASIEPMELDDVLRLPAQGQLFDAVLADVPCSNTGVLAKRPEARYRLTEKSISKIVKTQADILETAAHLIRQGGRICYSTCSIEPAENEQQIERFLSQHSDFKLKSQKLTLPTTGWPDRDGGFWAVLVRD